MASESETLHLILYQPDRSPRHLAVSEERITMGRAGSCTIPIPDQFLSRQHAEIHRIGDRWFLTDNGSSNGTFINGVKVTTSHALVPGDRIALGDAELTVQDGARLETELTITVDEEDSRANLSVSMIDIATADQRIDQTTERFDIVNRLAMDLLEDKPMNELFDFIVDKVMQLLTPSRVALAILGPDRRTFTDVRLRSSDENDTADLAISQTLLQDVVENRKVLSYTDVTKSELLKQAKSIMSQSIRSTICAPLIVEDSVLGVLYLDYLITQRSITEEDAKLAGKIAQIAARKLETTQLRENAVEKQKLDEEMKTAFVIQSRLLPSSPPDVEGFRFEGHYRPCRTVSGDYYDFVERPDGRIYFIIADVSGKGLTAALVMAGVAAAFNTLTNFDPTPAKLFHDLNEMLARKTDAAMFVTAFCAVLDPKSAVVTFCNAGHNPPFVIDPSGNASQLELAPGLVLGFIPEFNFKDETLQLEPGATLYLYTDGITEAVNTSEELFTEARLLEALSSPKPRSTKALAFASLAAVDEFVKGAMQADDMTLICVQRSAEMPQPTLVSGETTVLRRDVKLEDHSD